MTERVYNNPVTDDIFVEGPEGETVWSTQRPPVNLLPENDWITLSPFTFSYPDFSKGGGYGYVRYSNPFGFDSDGCITGVTLLPQSWDSGAEVVGSVPAGCNYIDVRVTMTRTKNPSNILDVPVANNLPSQETVLPGGWCLVESEFMYSRTFEFYLSGTSIMFRRKQNTRTAQAGENPSWTSNYNTTGWSWWGDPDGALVGKIDEQSGTLAGDGSRRRDGNPSYRCSMDTSGFDFSSTYSGTVVIRPGYIRT